MLLTFLIDHDYSLAIQAPQFLLVCICSCTA